MRWVAALLVLGSMLVPTAATACGNLSAYGRRMQAEREARFLEGSRIVEGRWHTETGDDDDGYRSGTIMVSRRGRETGRNLSASGRLEVNCGFPLFPHEGDAGRFYLRREDGDWRIIHFIPDRDQRAAPQGRTQ